MIFRAALPYLALHLMGTLCTAMIVPFMGFFIVQGLGQEPWTISIYALLGVLTVTLLNRQIGKRLDDGSTVFPLLAFAILGFAIAAFSLSISPSLGVVFSLGVFGFAIGSSSVSTVFTAANAFASRKSIQGQQFDSYLRATSSLGWMIAPAISYLIADYFGPTQVFKLAAILVLLWAVMLFKVMPRDLTIKAKNAPVDEDEGEQNTLALWLAVAVCFCLSMAHSLTFQALPLFYVQEVGLPTYAPGTHFTVKTFIEIFAILSVPFLITSFGIRNTLAVTILLGALAIQVLALVGSMPQMIGGAALEGLYYGLYASLSISFVQLYAGNRPGRAMAMYWNALMMTGLFAGPAVGLMAQFHSFQLAIQVASIGAIVSFLILMRARSLAPARTKEQREQSAKP